MSVFAQNLPFMRRHARRMPARALAMSGDGPSPWGGPEQPVPDNGSGGGGGGQGGDGGSRGGAPGQGGLPWLVIAISAGALSAIFMAGLGTPSIFSLIMFLFMPAPLFMAGLSFGWLAAGIGALTALALLAGMLGMKAALMHLVMVGLPVVWLARLAWQRRPAAGAAEGEPADAAGYEWYPEGRLLLWMAGLAGVGVTLLLLSLGTTLAEVQGALRGLAEEVMRATGIGSEATAEQKRQFLDIFVAIAPLSVVVMWELSLYLSFRVADWATRKMGLNARPAADFTRLTFPQKALLGLAGLSLAALAPDIFGLVGEVLAVAFMAAFAILGLSVIHAWVKDKPWQPLALGALYAALLMLTGLVAPALLLLGLAETGFGVRRMMLEGGGR